MNQFNHPTPFYGSTMSTPLMRTCIFFALMCTCTLFLPLHCLADVEDEVNHLLQFVEESNCDFIRNGNHYASLEASRHLRKKYNYHKSRISKTEDFITYAASKSSISGKIYTVNCEGVKAPSSLWLTSELLRYRRQME
jgi:hypothetical protein